MHDEVDQEDRIQLPPGWGPVIFLAVVVLLSDLALGLRVRSMLVNRTVATAPAGSGMPAGAGAVGAGSMPNVPLAGQAAPGTAGGPLGSGVGTQPGAAASSFEIDESEFTEELDAYVRSVAEASGMDPATVPTARQVYQQMQRSGLLPVNGDLDVQTVLGGHVREMAKHASGQPGMGGAGGQPGTKGGQPGKAPAPAAKPDGAGAPVPAGGNAN